MRPPRGKVFIRPDEQKSETAGGILLPDIVITRDRVQTGVVVAIPAFCYQVNVGDRVCYNTYAAREIDDELVVSRISDLLAAIYPRAFKPCKTVNDVVLVRPLCPDMEASAGGVLLTERYRAHRAGGFDTNTNQRLQMGVGMVVGCPNKSWLNAGLWTIFNYRHATYVDFVVDGHPVEHVFLHDDEQTFLAIISHELIVEHFGVQAEQIYSAVY
jgi:co-chaperonin GroES (HSP10)